MSMLDNVKYITETLRFPVFPLAPGTHGQPTIKKWQHKATTSPITCMTWWKRNPNYNPAILTGKNLAVVDVDSKEHGGKHDGMATYEAIQEEFPTTFTVQTPSGGMHLYYSTTPEQISELNIINATNWLPGIDIRSTGGYVAGPGSRRDDWPGKTYAIIREIPLAPLPTKLFQQVKERADKRKAKKNRSGTPSNSITSSLITSETSEYSTLPESVPLGQRDDTLFRYACSWRERGYAYDHARVLMEALHARCEESPVDPITSADAIAKLDRAWAEYTPGERDEPPKGMPVQQAREGQPAQTYEPPPRPTTPDEVLERFIFIEEGERVADLKRHPKQAILKHNTFKLAYKNCKINGREMPVLWLANRHRQTVKDTVYWPHSKQIINYQGQQFFNTYVGSDLEVNMENLKYDGSKVDVFLDHMNYMFPGKDDYELIMNWLTFTVIYPHKRIPWAPLLISKPGVGKSWLYLLLCKLLGEENCSLIRDADLESAFNGFLSEKTLVCLDDVERGKQLQLALNSMLTAPTLTINHKYGKTGTEKMFFNFICFTNPGRAIQLQQNDRRFWVNNIEAAPRSDSYYTQLFDWLETDGPAHLFNFMSRQDLSNFRYAAPPAVTEAKANMIDASLNIYEEMILNAINEQTGVFAADIVDPGIVEMFIKTEMGRDQLSNNDINQIRRALAKYGSTLPQKRYRVKVDDSMRSSKIFSLRVVRHVEHWRAADDSRIVEEFRKAWCLALGVK